ncbi:MULTISPECIES: DMT family transporter [unclassified Bacillus (in: firmicutes)]|uniref:DMT family transporter n=1 Tax=unclassified Bacillus (in: firmicutes) TaxID=185979 RepID=UPI001BE4E192|nr:MULTISPECIES: DMT family transporter [unclassified Bacillus (in: firmicutes)]MBT2641974.1 DMT family transporter [Bacillus sp. ISL-41]MBT2662363.1 DMT family transporter [Bacillus sp. ISL-45]
MKASTFADLSLLFVALIWGATFVLVQNAISFLEPQSFNAVRFTLAAILLGLWLMVFEKDQLKKLDKKLILSGIMLGFWLFIGYAFQTLGLLYTTSSKAGFITGLSVVLVPLLMLGILKQRPSLNSIAGVSAATAGLYLLTMSDVSSLNIGDGFVLICAAGFALHIVFTGKFSSSYPTLLLTMVQIATVGALSAISAILFEDWKRAFNPEVIFSANVLIALLVTSILATALAFFIQTNFQKHTTATRVALIFAMEPVFAAITAYFWADERLTYIALAGCVLIFAGMVFAELPSGKFESFIRKIIPKKEADFKA